MLNMSTFFKVRTGQNRGITGVSAVDSTVRVGKRIISVKTIGFYIVSPVGKVIINYLVEFSYKKVSMCVSESLYVSHYHKFCSTKRREYA